MVARHRHRYACRDHHDHFLCSFIGTTLPPQRITDIWLVPSLMCSRIRIRQRYWPKGNLAPGIVRLSRSSQLGNVLRPPFVILPALLSDIRRRCRFYRTHLCPPHWSNSLTDRVWKMGDAKSRSRYTDGGYRDKSIGLPHSSSFHYFFAET